MKIVFMGTPDFAKPTLERLSQSRHEVVGVFSQPDKPRGRGKVILPLPVKSFALSQNIPVYQPPSLKDDDVFKTIKFLNPDIIIVVAYGHLLPLKIINYPRLRCVNLHASLLPKYRGAAPINWVLIRGEKETGVTTMLMEESLDTGDILLQEKISISPNDNVMTLHDELAILGAKKILETVSGLEKGLITPVKQNHARAIYAPKLKKEDGLINWECSVNDISNLIRGTYKWPGAYTFFKDNRLKILKAKMPIEMHEGKPASVLDIRQNGIEVATQDGSLLITTVQPEGKPGMDAYQFSLGHKIKAGDYFNSSVT